ncbi:1,4-dihydroxy-2-naphthoate octaprenyltransferase [Enterococcus avium]|uniref:prenyltransferase n=1 Tax=Enterococcus malodoratus TaxID=71451 RepID=UPI0008BAB329|nr:prenyltransferase [Enterococcus malodoratus]BBM18240.1 1,4-dihydroxy-2-naphthoate octaprenyltransferase [Enterococcus avium]SET82344.1 1,4-dihydroxy-2-naphthoate octaprenyltransferase [Enterococcus malodoratus]
MNLTVFLELVEFKAKTASVLPFFIGICFSLYNFHKLHLGLVLLYFIAMFIFNMAVDILDNYNDYHHATEIHDYREKTNIIGRENLDLKLVFQMMMGMIIVSALIGIGLSFVVGWPFLLMGLFCYGVGIFYSSGPKPLSSLPLGEVFSGLTMGFMITCLCVYLNTYEVFRWSFTNISEIFLISLPNTLWIANLMLANNICDLEEDEKNNRFTLVHYLGKQRAIRLFVGMNLVAFLAILLSIVIGIAPWSMLGTIFAVPYIYKQIQMFLTKQVKRETFICAVRILAVGAAAQVSSFALVFLF